MASRVLIVDDHELFLSGLIALLENQPGLEVVGHAKDGRQAMRKARELKPDLVILDVSMPGLNGIEATRRITKELGMKALCLSMYAETRIVTAALEAGAQGYLTKDCELEELLRAIRTVMGGQTYLCPAVAGAMVNVLRNKQPLARPSADSVLTDREREVLQLVAEGYSTQEIAEKLCMSPKTVHTHRKHLQEKLHIRSVAGLTKYAVREGLASSEPDYVSDP